MFQYYLFLNKLHRDPIDMEDFADGIVAVSVIIGLEQKLAGNT